jgi:hypothetical protein
METSNFVLFLILPLTLGEKGLYVSVPPGIETIYTFCCFWTQACTHFEISL